MKLTKAQREQVRLKFGGKCAYCGCDLPERWHADHIEPIGRTDWFARLCACRCGFACGGALLGPGIFFPRFFQRVPVHTVVGAKAVVLGGNDGTLEVVGNIAVVHPLLAPRQRTFFGGDAPRLRALE